MKTSTIIWIIVVILVILGVWYFLTSSGPSTQAPATQTPTTTAQTTPPPPQPVNILATSSSTKLGSYLVSADTGMTLYTFKKDSMGTTTCYGQCATNWPPFTVRADTQLAQLMNATGTVATITRADGATQVTYNGMPLYFYIKDVNKGDTNGQAFAKAWYVAKP